VRIIIDPIQTTYGDDEDNGTESAEASFMFSLTFIMQFFGRFMWE
jgi:hypothetical protein